MFLNFFYKLKAKKIPVSTIELMDLHQVILKFCQTRAILGLEDFYYIARNCLIKDLKYYDDYDLVFATEFSQEFAGDEPFRNQLQQWLQNAIQKQLSEAQKQQAPQWDIEKLRQELEKRLQEQRERHDGGNYWIGTGGTSPFGHSGYNPAGIRIGGESSHKMALNSARARNYKDYRSEEALNVRQIKMALKKLKQLKKTGREKLSIESSIQKTCQNGGDIEFVYEKERKNHLKLILLMDVGGSMTPHSRRVSQLFSAGHQLNHFKEFKYFYFHNIIYDEVYLDASMQKGVAIEHLYKKYNSDTRVIFVGDALMNPYEYFMQTGYRGFMGFWQDEKDKSLTGQQRLMQLKGRFPASIWLNPEEKMYWQEPTIEAIAAVVPMFFLSIGGIESAIKELVRD